MSFVELLEVAQAKSPASTRTVLSPRSWASKAHPAPVAPPPITHRSKLSFSIPFQAAARLFIGQTLRPKLILWACCLGRSGTPVICVRSILKNTDAGCADGGANQRSNNGNQRISPVRLALPGDGQQGVCQAWAKIARRIHRVSRRTTDDKPERPHQYSPKIGSIPGRKSIRSDQEAVNANPTPTRVAVAIISVTALAGKRRIAGAVQKIPSFAAVSVVSFQCGR